jgi:hypothetical protein
MMPIGLSYPIHQTGGLAVGVVFKVALIAGIIAIPL